MIELDHHTPDKAATSTTAQLKGWLARFVARNTTDDRAARAEKQRRAVWVEHQADGMSWPHAYLPTTDAVRIDADLTVRATAPPSDGRTLDRKRVDLLAQLIQSLADGRPVSSRAIIGITVPVTMIAGWDDAPGDSFDGTFTLPADAVRDLAAEPRPCSTESWPIRWAASSTSPSWAGSPATSSRLRSTSGTGPGTCRFPTRNRPAMQSDKDHKVPHPRGPTSGDNLRPLCRRHHNLKTHGIAEPTDHAMVQHTTSRTEHDLATFTVRMQYAA